MEAKDATKQPTTHTTVFMTNKYQAPNASDAKVDKSCSRRGGGELDEITVRVCAMQAGQKNKQGVPCRQYSY